MTLQKMFAPVNSIVFLEGRSGGTPPEPVWGGKILATESCISIACCPEVDSATLFVVGKFDEIDPGTSPEFDAPLLTPDRDIILSTVDGETILQMPVSQSSTRIRVWRSHPEWPEEVRIGWG